MCYLGTLAGNQVLANLLNCRFVEGNAQSGLSFLVCPSWVHVTTQIIKLRPVLLVVLSMKCHCITRFFPSYRGPAALKE